MLDFFQWCWKKYDYILYLRYFKINNLQVLLGKILSGYFELNFNSFLFFFKLMIIYSRSPGFRVDSPATTAGLLCPPSGFTHSSRLNFPLGNSSPVVGFNLSCSWRPLKYRAVIQEEGTLSMGLCHGDGLPTGWLTGGSTSSTSPEESSSLRPSRIPVGTFWSPSFSSWSAWKSCSPVVAVGLSVETSVCKLELLSST